MNKIRDDDKIIQIATERGYSCGDRRRAILLTAHSTFTQQTQYTDNMATLNERQFFLLTDMQETSNVFTHRCVSCAGLRGLPLRQIYFFCSTDKGCSGPIRLKYATISLAIFSSAQ